MAKQEPDWPPLLGEDHLIDWLLEVGPMLDNGMSMVSLPHGEIADWSRNTKTDLFSIEARWLHKLSRSYADERAKSDDKDVPNSPYLPPEEG